MVDHSSPSRGQLHFKICLLLWAIAFLPRLILAAVFFHHPIALDDMYQYDMLARSIHRGDGYRWYRASDFEKLKGYYEQFVDLEDLSLPEEGIRTAHRAPGYPLFLSGIYPLVPQPARFGWTRVVQAALTAGLAPLTALIALHSGLGAKTARISGLVMALYPILHFYPLALASENTFIPLLAAGYLLLLLSKSGKGLWTLLGSSLLLGLSTLTRSVVALFMLFGAGWLHVKRKLTWKHTGLFLLVAFGLCLPWAIRNTQLMGKPTFLETSLGYNLFISYHPQGHGGFISDIAIKPLTLVEDQARDRYTTQKALQFIKNDPGDALLRVFRKTAFFTGLEDREMIYFYGNGIFGEIPQPWRLILYLGLVLPWVGILFLFPLGLIHTGSTPPRDLALGLIVTYTLPHLLIIAEPRFHLALVPVLIPYTAYGWVYRKRIFHQLRQGKNYQAQRWLILMVWVLILGLLAWNLSLYWDTLAQVMGPEGHKLRLTY